MKNGPFRGGVHEGSVDLNSGAMELQLKGKTTKTKENRTEENRREEKAREAALVYLTAIGSAPLVDKSSTFPSLFPSLFPFLSLFIFLFLSSNLLGMAASFSTRCSCSHAGLACHDMP